MDTERKEYTFYTIGLFFNGSDPHKIRILMSNPSQKQGELVELVAPTLEHL